MIFVMVTIWAILAVQLIHPINYRTQMQGWLTRTNIAELLAPPVTGYGMAEIANAAPAPSRASGKQCLRVFQNTNPEALKSSLPIAIDLRLLLYIRWFFEKQVAY